MAIEILFYNETDKDVKSYQAIVKEIITEAARFEKLNGRTACNYIFVDNPKIRQMNYKYLQKDSATDVLTFANEALSLPGGRTNLGDVFISLDKVIEQADEYGHSQVREIAFLAVHGFLHLLGYDHMTKEAQTQMFAKQEAILNAKNIRR